MKLLPVLACAFVFACSDSSDKLSFHSVKVHLAGAEYAKLAPAALSVLAESGARDVVNAGDSMITAHITNASPAATFGIEMKLKRKSDGVWYEVSSENWNDSLGKKVNQRFADKIADKMGFVIQGH